MKTNNCLQWSCDEFVSVVSWGSFFLSSHWSELEIRASDWLALRSQWAGHTGAEWAGSQSWESRQTFFQIKTKLYHNHSLDLWLGPQQYTTSVLCGHGSLRLGQSRKFSKIDAKFQNNKCFFASPLSETTNLYLWRSLMLNHWFWITRKHGLHHKCPEVSSASVD